MSTDIINIESPATKAGAFFAFRSTLPQHRQNASQSKKQSHKRQGNGDQTGVKNFRKNEGYNQGGRLHFIDNYLDISTAIKNHTQKHKKNSLLLSSLSQALCPFHPVHPYTPFREMQ